MCTRRGTSGRWHCRVNCPQVSSERVPDLRSLSGPVSTHGRTTVRRWSLRLVAGLAVAMALVGGCSSKHEANDTLPSASETSATPSLEPLGPADLPMPDDARSQDAAGAEAFVRYYMAVYS